MDGRTDDLLDRFRAGDAAAYEVLWRRYHRPLRDFLRHHVFPGGGFDVTVDDLLQDTHLEALRGLSSFVYRRELAFFFWLCGIARRLLAGRLRRQGRRARLLPSARFAGAPSSVELLGRVRQASAAGADPHAALRLREHLDLLALGLDQLAGRRREAILLRYIEELGAEEAAARMGMTPGAFRVLLARALAELRRGVAELAGEAAAASDGAGVG
jgi:RNA polymerase sigma factor (sigma-70 family)